MTASSPTPGWYSVYPVSCAEAHPCCTQALSKYSTDGLQSHAAFVLLQNFSNTLQVVFADVPAHSMQPVCPEPSTTAPQAAACSCRGAAPSNNSSAMPSETAHSTNSFANDPANQQTQQPPAVLLSQQQPGHSAILPERNHNTGAALATGSSMQRPPGVLSDACLATASSEGIGEEDGRVTGQLGGYRWQLPAGVTQDECIMLWVGPDTVPTLTHLHLTFNK